MFLVSQMPVGDYCYSSNEIALYMLILYHQTTAMVSQRIGSMIGLKQNLGLFKMS